MSTFSLRIGTPDGLLFEGDVERVVCRSVGGDIAILARHCNFCTALGMGEASVVMADGNRRTAACIGGMLTMMNGECRLIPTTWEWSDDMDVARAEKAKKLAEEKLNQSSMDDKEVKLAEAKLHRALVRIGTAQK